MKSSGAPQNSTTLGFITFIQNYFDKHCIAIFLQKNVGKFHLMDFQVFNQSPSSFFFL